MELTEFVRELSSSEPKPRGTSQARHAWCILMCILMCTSSMCVQHSAGHADGMRVFKIECVIVCAHVCRWFLQQLVLTMEYFHRRNIAHRDIKLENTLLKVRTMHTYDSLCGTCGVSCLYMSGGLLSRIGRTQESTWPVKATCSCLPLGQLT
jgi:hypothetical protein